MILKSCGFKPTCDSSSSKNQDPLKLLPRPYRARADEGTPQPAGGKKKDGRGASDVLPIYRAEALPSRLQIRGWGGGQPRRDTALPAPRPLSPWPGGRSPGGQNEAPDLRTPPAPALRDRPKGRAQARSSQKRRSSSPWGSRIRTAANTATGRPAESPGSQEDEQTVRPGKGERRSGARPSRQLADFRRTQTSGSAQSGGGRPSPARFPACSAEEGPESTITNRGDRVRGPAEPGAASGVPVAWPLGSDRPLSALPGPRRRAGGPRQRPRRPEVAAAAAPAPAVVSVGGADGRLVAAAENEAAAEDVAGGRGPCC